MLVLVGYCLWYGQWDCAGAIISVADPHRKKADTDADPGKNLNTDVDADVDSLRYFFKGTVQ